MTAKAPDIWPPDYNEVFVDRAARLQRIRKDADIIYALKVYYSDPGNWIKFINDWIVTYDPRAIKDHERAINPPFILFPRQEQLLQFLIECWQDGENGLVEKSRDMGATWLCCALSTTMWLFAPGSSIGWGSRKQNLVDEIGVPDSIFEKMRIIIKNLPIEFLPDGFDDRIHSHSMRIISPENGSTITGEIGDNIGRGGRKSIYIKDESAHYERPELIEAALGDNTDVQIDISSVNGPTNIFARRRKSGTVWEPGKKFKKGEQRVFIMDWRDHPEKTQEWYDRRREKAEREGLIHLFAQEVDRDYAASVSGALIPSIWINAAVDAHLKFPELQWTSGIAFSGLDVADEGEDSNAQAIRKGSLLTYLEEWAQGDTGQTAQKSIVNCGLNGCSVLNYDCVGVGAGVKGETNRIAREKKLGSNIQFVGWNSGFKPIDSKKRFILKDKDSPTNEEMFFNLKAQAGWRLRIRFEKTWRKVTQGIDYPVDEMISIPSNISHFHDLKDQLSQPQFTTKDSGKLIIDKKPPGTKSPNLYDAVCIAYNPYKYKISKMGTW